jgi:hypothetical protein
VSDVRGRAGSALGRCAVAVAVAGVLAGCGGGTSVPAARSSAATSSAFSVTGTSLSAGLLPAGAFDPRATVLDLSLDQLRQAFAATGTTGPVGRVDPPSCAVAVEGGGPDLTGVADLAAESAVGPAGTTVEALLTGPPVQDAVDRVLGAVAACPQATVTTAEGTTATITFRPVPLPRMGEDAAAMQVTTSPSGSASTSALVGVVRDGDRLLLLLSASRDGDARRFTALLQQAFATQARALD